MTQEKSKVILGDQFYWNEMMGLWLKPQKLTKWFIVSPLNSRERLLQTVFRQKTFNPKNRPIIHLTFWGRSMTNDFLWLRSLSQLSKNVRFFKSWSTPINKGETNLFSYTRFLKRPSHVGDVSLKGKGIDQFLWIILTEFADITKDLGSENR